MKMRRKYSEILVAAAVVVLATAIGLNLGFHVHEAWLDKEIKLFQPGDILTTRQIMTARKPGEYFRLSPSMWVIECETYTRREVAERRKAGVRMSVRTFYFASDSIDILAKHEDFYMLIEDAPKWNVVDRLRPEKSLNVSDALDGLSK